MNKRDELRYRRATAVRTFGSERAGDFPPGSKAAELFAALAQQLTDLDVAMAQQIPTRTDKRPLLKQLDADCRNIARTARAIGIAGDDAAFANPYRMPDKLGETALLTHVDTLRALLQDQGADSVATLQAKAALRARFNAFELPMDFIDTLSQRAISLRSVGSSNQAETQGGVENTMRIGHILDGSGETIRQLDAIMVNKYAADPGKLHVWKTTSRVERLPRKSKAAGVTSTEAP